MRIYNPSLGRFLSVDPYMHKYPWFTPYQFAGNNPVHYTDLDGLEPDPKAKNGIDYFGSLQQSLSENTIRNEIINAIAKALAPNVEINTKPGYNLELNKDAVIRAAVANNIDIDIQYKNVGNVSPDFKLDNIIVRPKNSKQDQIEQSKKEKVEFASKTFDVIKTGAEITLDVLDKSVPTDPISLTEEVFILLGVEGTKIPFKIAGFVLASGDLGAGSDLSTERQIAIGLEIRKVKVELEKFFANPKEYGKEKLMKPKNENQ